MGFLFFRTLLIFSVLLVAQMTTSSPVASRKSRLNYEDVDEILLPTDPKRIAGQPQLDEESTMDSQIQTPHKNNGPNLSSMLNIFNNGFDINDIGALAKDFKFATHLVKSLMTVSPMCRDITNAVAEKNVEVRILLKLSLGKYPDLKDMFELATGPHGNMGDDFTEAGNKNKAWREILKLEKDPFVNENKLLEVFIGKKFDPNPVHNISVDNKYSVTSTGINPVVYEYLLFLLQNVRNLKGISAGLGHVPTDWVDILRKVTNLNFSHFPTGINAGKSTSTPKLKSEIMDFLHEVRVKNPQILNGPNVETEAESAATGELESLLTIFTDTLDLLKPREVTNNKQ